jgi:Rrf2 family protein
MMLSHTAEYALRIVVFLAGRAEAPVRIDEIAAALRIPRNYLSKIVHRLAREGVLQSTRGKGGGFQLARPADQLPLLDVIALFDSVGPERRCLLGREVCSDRSACEAHASWKDVADRIAAFFSQTTVADLSAGPRSARAGPDSRPVARR